MYGLTIHWDLGFTHIDKLFFKLDNDLTMIWGFQGVLLINGPLCNELLDGIVVLTNILSKVYM